MFELEDWSNDRIATEFGILQRIPAGEWVSGKPLSSVVMAAFCHPHPYGGRFNDATRGAWYAARDLRTAHAEAAYRRGAELREVGITEMRLQVRLYVATFNSTFHDLRGPGRDYAAFHEPGSYVASQALAKQLLDEGSNGVLYRSVRRAGGECISCFRPKLVSNVRVGGHFEYRWEGAPEPLIREL